MMSDEDASDGPESSVLLQAAVGASQAMLQMPTDDEFDDEEASLMQLPQFPEDNQDSESFQSLSIDEPVQQDELHKMHQMGDAETSALLQVGCEQKLDAVP